MPTGTEGKANEPSAVLNCELRYESTDELHRTMAPATRAPVPSTTRPRTVPRPSSATSTWTRSPFCRREPAAQPFEPDAGSNASRRKGFPSCRRTKSKAKEPRPSVCVVAVVASKLRPERSSVAASERWTVTFASGAPSGPRTRPSTSPPSTARRERIAISPLQLSPPSKGPGLRVPFPGGRG